MIIEKRKAEYVQANLDGFYKIMLEKLAFGPAILLGKSIAILSLHYNDAECRKFILSWPFYKNPSLFLYQFFIQLQLKIFCTKAAE